MDIQPFTTKLQEPIKGHAQINIEKICNDPATSTQALLASAIWCMFNDLTRVCEKLGIARGKLGLAAVQAGFNSANATAKAGLIELGGNTILAGAGVAQGVAGCKSATKFAQAAEKRSSQLAELKQSQAEAALPSEGSAITVTVEAVDQPVTPELDEVEEEVFYDAEETLSCQSTKPEEQTEEVKAQDPLTKEAVDQKKARIEKQYDVSKDKIEAEVSRIEGLATPGQALYQVSTNFAEQKRADGKREDLQKEVEQDNQNQLGNTVDDLKRKADKIAEFDPYRSNSSSSRG